MIPYQPAVTTTGSLDVSEMLELTGIPLALFAGVVERTVGAWSAAQMFSGENELRGSGVPATKSAELVFVSVQPPLSRRPAVVLASVGAGPAPSKKLAPSYPTRSMIRPSCAAEQAAEPPLQPREVVPVTSTTFPPVALML